MKPYQKNFDFIPLENPEAKNVRPNYVKTNGKLMTVRGYERVIKNMKSILYRRDYDKPHHNDVEKDALEEKDLWSTFRR